jgi:hypothetical protein
MSAIGTLPAWQGDAAPEGRRLPDAVSSWRQVFDREQMAALDKFRSVEAPAFATTSRERLAPGAAGGASAPPPPPAARSAAASGPAAATAPGGNPPHEERGTFIPAGSLTSSRGLPGPALASFPPRATRGGLPAALVDVVIASAAPLLQEKWPSHNLHWTAGIDGLHLWLRDSGAMPHDPVLQRWLNDLQGALAAAGIPLAGFTLNGKAYPIPPIVSSRS